MTNYTQWKSLVDLHEYSAIPDSGITRDYETDSLTGFDDGDLVEAIADQQNNDDLTGSGTYRDGGINNNVSVELNGTDDKFSASATHTTDVYTIGIVFQLSDLNDRYQIWQDGEQGSSGHRFEYFDSDNNYRLIHDDDGDLLTAGTGTTDPVVIVGRYDGDRALYRLNGSVLIDESASYTAPSGSESVLIGERSDGSLNAPMDYGRSIHYANDLSNDDFDNLESTLAEQYDIELS